MTIGGEFYALRRHALASFRAGDSHESLSVRVSLAKDVQAAEKKWRDRMLKLLETGWGTLDLGFLVAQQFIDDNVGM